MSPANARYAKTNMAVAFKTRSVAPFYQKEESFLNATLSTPYDGFFVNEYIVIDIDRILFYDINTGKILHFIDPYEYFAGEAEEIKRCLEKERSVFNNCVEEKLNTVTKFELNIVN